MSIHRTPLLAGTIVLFLLCALQCSSNDNITSPSKSPDPIIRPVENSSGGDLLLGLWQFTVDFDKSEISIAAQRQGDYSLNALKFLEKVPYTNVSVDFATIVFDSVNKAVHLDLKVAHTATSPEGRFDIFDMRGVIFGPQVSNADGWTAMMNPTDFAGVQFGYTDGLLGTPNSTAHYASKDYGYKYFADGLGRFDDYVAFFSDEGNLTNRGVFEEGHTNWRHYDLQWGPGTPNYLVFNYALATSYDFPEGAKPYNLDSFSINANAAESFCGNATVTDNDVHITNGNAAGNLSLDMEVWDWQGLGSTEVDVEADFLAAIDPVTSHDAGNTSKSGIFHLNGLTAGGPASAGIHDIWITATDASKTFGSSWLLGVLPPSNPRYNDYVYTVYRYQLDIPANSSPTAVAVASTLYPYRDIQMTLDASPSTDNESPDGDLTFEWDLDGDAVYDDANGMIINQTYNTDGNYTADVRVTDPGGLSDTLDTPLTLQVGYCGSGLAHEDNDGTINITSGYSVLPNTNYRHAISFMSEGVNAGKAVVQTGPYSLGVIDADAPGNVAPTTLCKLRPFYYLSGTGPTYTSNAALEMTTCPVGGYVIVVTDSIQSKIDGTIYHTDQLDAYAPDGSGIKFSTKVLGQSVSIIAVDCDDNGDIWLVGKLPAAYYLFKLRYVGGSQLWQVNFSIANALDLTNLIGDLSEIIDIGVDYSDNRVYVFYYNLDHIGRLLAVNISSGSPVNDPANAVNDIFSSPILPLAYAPTGQFLSLGHIFYAGMEIDHQETAKEKCRIVIYSRLSGSSETPEVVRLNHLGQVLERHTGTTTYPEFAINNDASESIRDLVFCANDAHVYLWDTPEGW